MYEPVAAAADIVRRARFSEFEEPQRQLAWSPDGTSLLTASDRVVHLLDSAHLHCRFEEEVAQEAGTITSLAWRAAPGPREFAVVCAERLHVITQDYRRSPRAASFRRIGNAPVHLGRVFPAPDSSEAAGEQFLATDNGKLKAFCKQASPPGLYEVGAFTSNYVADLAWSPNAGRAAVTLIEGFGGGVYVGRVPALAAGHIDGSSVVSHRLQESESYFSRVHAWMNGPIPEIAWFNDCSLLVLEGRTNPRLIRYEFDIEHMRWFECYSPDLAVGECHLAGDPVHERYAIATDDMLYVVEHRGIKPWIRFQARLAPTRRTIRLAFPGEEEKKDIVLQGVPATVAFSPDGLRLAVTRRVLQEGEVAEETDPHRVTVLDIGPSEVPEAREIDPRYADGAPPSDSRG